MKMVSIIIPVYNTSFQDLARCIKSILDQPYVEYEILLIDDNSKCLSDSDFEMIRKMDKRISIIHHPNNLGVSAARNTGIKYAKGDYIAFVDGDDEIDSRFLTEATELAAKYHADLVIGTLQYVYDGKREEINEDDKEYYFNNDITALRRSHLKLSEDELPYTILGSSSAKLIKKTIVNNNKFNEKISIFEDQIFVRGALLSSREVIYIHHIWYYYYQHDTSSFYSFEKNNGRKAMRFNPEYIKANNAFNIIEPDELTRYELLNKSIWEFAAAVNYWIVQNKDSNSNLRESKKKIASLYNATNIQSVIESCPFSRLKKFPIKVLYILIKHKQFGILYLGLTIANSFWNNINQKRSLGVTSE